jgi:hypothetical protein
VRSAVTARREFALIRKALSDARARECLSRLFDELGSQNGPIHVGRAAVRVTVGELRLIAVRVDAATRRVDRGLGLSLSMRVTYTASALGRTVTVPTSYHLEALAFRVGRAEVTLSTEALGASLSPELEAKLFSLLVSRALTASRVYPDIGS